MEKTWTVVQFTNEEIVEAVPTTWIINNKCYWPPFQMEKIVAAIKKHAEPNTCWPSYDIATFRNSSYDNYRTAREKAKKAEFTSELASDTDNNKVSKRKVIQKKFSSSSDSLAEDSVLRTPPVMQESSQSTSRVNSKSNNSQLKSTNPLSSKNTDKQTKHLSHKLLDNNYTLNNNYTSRDDEPNVQSNETENVDNSNVVRQYFEEIIRQQSYLKAQLWQIADDFRTMKDELLQQNHQQPNANGREKSLFSLFDLPFNSVKDIEQLLEQYLNESDNFETSVKEVSRVGGKNPYEFIKRNCTLLLTNELAEKYSWLGAKQKLKFCHLKLADLLIVSGQDSNSKYTRKELEEAIQKWLRRAKERCTTKKNKLKDKEKINEH